MHMMLLHSGEKPFVCNQCGYSTIKDDHLKMHMTVTVERSLLLANSATTPAHKQVTSRHTCGYIQEKSLSAAHNASILA